MAWNISDRFPSWGEDGEFPATGFFYEGGDQVNEKHMDALWNGINGLEGDVQAALNDLDSDGDGEVDAADIARALDSSKVGDGLNGGDGTELSVDVTDLLGDGLTEGSNNFIFDESSIKDGGVKEIDAQEFAGADGTSGQVLTTNGAAVSWESPPTGRTANASGLVDQGDAANLYVEEIADGARMEITTASLVNVDGTAVPSGCDLVIATLDNNGGGAVQTTILSGDGTTVYDEVNGSPYASYTNTSGSPQTIMVAVDNGQFNQGSGSQVEVHGNIKGQEN